MSIGLARLQSSALFSLLVAGWLTLPTTPLVSPAEAQLPAKLLLQTVCVTGNSQEYVAIYNPNNTAVDLSNYYITDAIHIPDTYYLYITNRSAGIAGGGTFFDWHVRFPAGATIAAHDTIAVAHQSAATFASTYGRKPAFEVGYTGSAAPANDPGVPDMRAAFPGSVPSVPDSATLSNSGECVTIYYWDGQTDLVTDVDYVFWGSNSLTFVNDKTGKSIDGPDADSTPTAYQPDTAPASQVPIFSGAHANGNAFRRDDFTEGSQKTSGGNGVGGRDETSENLASTWSTTNPASPPFVKGAVQPATLTARAGGPYSALLGSAINFSGAASTPAQGETITAYSWNFGDGSAAGSGVTTSHTYAAVGSYTVTLTVTGSGGGTHSASTTATVSAVPVGGAIKKLMFQTVCVTGNSQEYLAVYNPNNESVDLSNYYITDAIHIPDTYYLYITNRSAGLAGGGTFFDFHIRFPAGATIAAHDTIAVAHQSAATFSATYGRKPAFEVAYTGSAAPTNDSSVPDMRAAFPGSVPSVPDSATLSNAGESVAMYYWDGQSDLVTDVDYVFWGSNSLTYVLDKTGKSIDGPDADSAPTAYKADTTPSSQVPVASTGHTNGNAFRREDFTEGSQKTSGGNGVDGRDETSENLAVTWSSTNPASPPFVKGSTPPPPGQLTAVPGGPYAGVVNQSVTFNGTGSTAPTGGSIAGYAWTFGDGGTASGPTVTHTYSAVGTFAVTLTVTSNTGATHAASTSCVVTSTAPIPSSKGALQVKARTFLPTLREKFPITIEVPGGNQATLRIFDLDGREIAVLFDGDASGPKTYQWDGRDAQLMLVPAGTYICDLEVRNTKGGVVNYQAPIVVARRLERN